MDNAVCHAHEHHHVLKRISWSAVFAGAIVGMGLGFLLNLFAVAMGLSAFTVNTMGGVVLAVGGFIGVLIGIIVSMLAAGYTAGYLGRCHTLKCNIGILYGFLTWSLMLLLSAVFVMHMSRYVAIYTTNITPSGVVINKNQATPSAVQARGQASQSKAQGQQNQLDQAQAINAMPTAADLTRVAFTVFMLFLISAVSTCIGACWGMCCRKEEKCKEV